MSERRTSDDELPQGLLATNQEARKTFRTGAVPTPRHKLAAATPFRPFFAEAPPSQFARVPQRLDMWDNDRDGVCVTSDEAFAKACHNPEIFIDASTVRAWAQRHGWLNGAMLTDVMDAMQSDGFVVGQQRYNDGPYSAVDYSRPDVLNAALFRGPVKIAIDHEALPSGAGNQQGWYAVGGRPGQFGNTDHCVGLSGYGPAQWLYQQLGVPLPSKLPPTQQGCLLFTWSTLGFVDHDWLMSTCVEAWLRDPTTVGVPPLPPEPDPNPPAPPVPPTPPGPNPPPLTFPQYLLSGTIQRKGWFGVTVTDTLSAVAVPGGQFHATPGAGPVGIDWQALIQDVAALIQLVQKIIADLQAQGRLRGPAAFNLFAVLQDAIKLITDFKTGQPWGVLLLDLRQLAADLGIVLPF